MDIAKSSIVRSVAGRDRGGYFFVLAAEGDYLLLCTDGLVETATDQEMEEAVLRGGDPNGCLDRLLSLAKRRGAADNVTAVLLRQL